MTYVYEFLAVMWMAAAAAIAFYSGATSATFAAGLSIAAATLGLLHENRRHAKIPRPPVFIDITMEELLEALAEEEPDEHQSGTQKANASEEEPQEEDELAGGVLAV